MTIVSGLVSRFTPSEIADIFIEASKEMMYGALLVGISRSIAVIMENAQIIDTVVYWLATMLQHFRGMASAMGMLFDHNANPCPSRRNGWCQPSGQRPGLPVW